MRAVVVQRLGDPGVLAVEERDPPVPRPGELLVDVAAAGVNFMDVYQREGTSYRVEPPFVLGAEGSGIVAATGSGVDQFKQGDRVAWTGAPGSYAEQVLVPAERAVAVPDGITLAVAAAAMLQGLTAHYLSHSTYAVQAGDLVGIHAAAGGVGLLLTQMVTLRGAIVVATTSTEAKAELARAAGATTVVRYEAFGEAVREQSGGSGAGVIYDSVGQATFEDSLAALRPRGSLVLYGASSGRVPPFDLQRLMLAGSLYVTRPTLAHYITDRHELLTRADDVFAMIADGRLKVRIGATYPLAEAARAHDDLEARRTTGKLLLLPA
jgi:NADPH:quinone reductase